MKQLDPKAIWLFFMRYIFITIFLVALFNTFFAYFFFLTTKVDENKVPLGEFLWSGFTYSIGWTLIFSILGFIFSYIWARLSYNFYRYELHDNGFRKELGVIWKKYVTITYDRIKNVDIYRGIWARLFGLSDLHIQTAGMSTVGKYGALS